MFYNYNGENMNRESIVLTIKNKNDLRKLNNSDIKYLNIDITNIDKNIIDYLKGNGKNYLYAESINNINGYIYVDYDTFLEAQSLIDNIILNTSNNLNELELAKYLYITLGKLIGYDINTIYDKNETFNFEKINTINNLWGSFYNCKATNQSYCKLYLYFCRLFDIKCDIVPTKENGYLCNKLTINNKTLLVDLTSDIPFIQANFRTKYFANYNNDIELDKKIGYIKDDYNEIKIDKLLRDIDYTSKDFFSKILLNTQKILEINKIKPIELGIIYDTLFSKYCPNNNISINNLYINNLYSKEHFILISYNNEHYSYNYNKKTFVKINEKELINNIENNIIGIYLNENIPISI